MRLGDRAVVKRSFARTHADAFARLAGLSESEKDAVPEPLVNALFSYLLGVELPGPGTNYLKQETEFLSPAPYGEDLEASVEIIRLRPGKDLVDLETVCRRKDGTLIARGRALVYVKDAARAQEES